MIIPNFFKRKKNAKLFNVKIDNNLTKIFWCKCGCECKEDYGVLEYNSNICKNCIGIRGKNKRNFGDLITSYIYTKIRKKKPMWCDDKDSTEPVYFGSGSMMNLCNGWNNVVVWGTGIIHSKDSFDNPTKVLAVRGPLTRKRFLELGYDCPEIYGDPGLLLSKFYNKKVPKKYEIGIIPHYVDYEFCKNYFANFDSVSVIDACNSVEQVIDDIRRCQRTISSSLHGIIVSHAYNIKSCWAKFSDYVYGDAVKYFDYYYSIGVDNVKKPITFDEEFNSQPHGVDYLVEIIENYPNPIFPINTEKLMKTCPF